MVHQLRVPDLDVFEAKGLALVLNLLLVEELLLLLLLLMMVARSKLEKYYVLIIRRLVSSSSNAREPWCNGLSSRLQSQKTWARSQLHSNIFSLEHNVVGWNQTQ